VDPPAAQIITEGCLRLVDRVAPPKTTERSKA
jgi:hypothetical protein